MKTLRTDVVVIGAGPAGSAAALGCARAGLRTLLAERQKFPRNKVCGCCVGALAQDCLGTLGVSDVLRAGVPLGRIRIQGGGGAAGLELERMVAMSRSAFDAALAEKARECGALWRDDTVATLVENSADACVVELHSGGELTRVECKVALVAAGLGGRFRRGSDADEIAIDAESYLGAGTLLPAGTFGMEAGLLWMVSAPEGYVGLVRIEDGRIDAAAALDGAAVKAAGGLGPAVGAILSANGIDVPPEFSGAAWRGTPALTRSRTHLAETRLFVLGDAASYLEPFTGEGIGWAMRDAIEVMPFVQRAASGWSDAIAAEWQAHSEGRRREAQRTCAVLRKVLRQPLLSSVAIGALSRLPILAHPVLAALGQR